MTAFRTSNGSEDCMGVQGSQVRHKPLAVDSPRHEGLLGWSEQRILYQTETVGAFKPKRYKSTCSLLSPTTEKNWPEVEIPMPLLDILPQTQETEDSKGLIGNGKIG
ncbi:hypothetical protein VTK73DRAFT_2435 [Phialemonium thermophilum]|uniref:Uncharacterized protein n=1 Tax=Phialemonium thermophilum TaxID=223376 RepID=A0ABR3X520_9PEZI